MDLASSFIEIDLLCNGVSEDDAREIRYIFSNRLRWSSSIKRVI